MTTVFTKQETKKRTTGGSGLLPPLVTAITVINGDQNTQVTQRGLADHLSGGESSLAPTVNASPSDVKAGGGLVCMRVCMHLDVGGRLSKLMASFHCGHLVSSDNMTVVSSVFQLCLQTRVTRTCS